MTEYGAPPAGVALDEQAVAYFRKAGIVRMFAAGGANMVAAVGFVLLDAREGGISWTGVGFVAVCGVLGFVLLGASRMCLQAAAGIRDRARLARRYDLVAIVAVVVAIAAPGTFMALGEFGMGGVTLALAVAVLALLRMPRHVLRSLG